MSLIDSIASTAESLHAEQSDDAQLIDRLAVALRNASDALEHVEVNYVGLSGSGIRQTRMMQANALLVELAERKKQ